MGATNFPYGIASLDGYAFAFGTANITGAGTVTTGLDTCVGINVSYAGSAGTASANVLTVCGTAHGAAGQAIIRTVRADSTPGTIAAPVVWAAIGTKA